MLVAGVAAWRAWLAEGGADAVGGRRPFAGRVLGAGGFGRADAGAGRAAGALPRRRRCSRRCRSASARWPPSSAWTPPRSSPAAPRSRPRFGAGSAEVVEAVNFNDPMQTVIAGSKAAVDKACEVLKANGAKRALPLPVSAPFHSSLMKPAAEALREQAGVDRRWRRRRFRCVNNIDVAVETDPDRIRDALVRQAAGPVRWVETVQALEGARRRRPSSNAAPARCWPAWPSASRRTWRRPRSTIRRRSPKPDNCSRLSANHSSS